MTGRLTRRRMDIERLVNWALADQGLGWGGDRPAREDYSDYGTTIDDEAHGSHPSISLLTDDDALVVKAAIDGLPPEARVLVIRYGRTGLRPEGADEQLGDPVQLVDKRGRPRWDYANPANKRGSKRPLLDILGFSKRRDDIAFFRAQWTLWREALVALIGPINLKCEGHYATGPEAPEKPWLAPRPVVHGIDAQRQARVRGDGVGGALSIDDIRLLAQAPVASRASDWSAPATAPRRPDRPPAVGKKTPALPAPEICGISDASK